MLAHSIRSGLIRSILPGATPHSNPISGATWPLAAELQAVGTISPAEQRALLDDLKQSDPALWPQLIKQFRAALAYRGEAQPGEHATQRPIARPERPTA